MTRSSAFRTPASPMQDAGCSASDAARMPQIPARHPAWHAACVKPCAGPSGPPNGCSHVSNGKSACWPATLMPAGRRWRRVGRSVSPTYDPAQLPEVKGKVAQYLLDPARRRRRADPRRRHRGAVPPFAFHPTGIRGQAGRRVTIHGLKARALPMVAAASVTNDATGVTVACRSGRASWRRRIEVQGRVKETAARPARRRRTACCWKTAPSSACRRPRRRSSPTSLPSARP